VRIRRANAFDIPVMEELKRESPTSSNWSSEHYESLFRTTAPESSKYFVLVAEDPSESESTAGSGSTVASVPIAPIVAYLAAHCVEGDWELQYIVVAKESRRRGVGTYLLNEFISHVRATGGRGIFLEVRESNQHARALYRKASFEETGLRKSYYSDPPENAILCQLRLY
jgi:[ribosomal protein S18]-alanine N-acetyltransferase